MGYHGADTVAPRKRRWEEPTQVAHPRFRGVWAAFDRSSPDIWPPHGRRSARPIGTHSGSNGLGPRGSGVAICRQRPAPDLLLRSPSATRRGSGYRRRDRHPLERATSARLVGRAQLRRPRPLWWGHGAGKTNRGGVYFGCPAVRASLQRASWAPRASVGPRGCRHPARAAPAGVGLRAGRGSDCAWTGGCHSLSPLDAVRGIASCPSGSSRQGARGPRRPTSTWSSPRSGRPGGARAALAREASAQPARPDPRRRATPSALRRL